MIFVLEHAVTYKDAPGEPQQKLTFPNKEVAQQFALAVEKDGGIAIYTSGYVKSNVSVLTPYKHTEKKP